MDIICFIFIQVATFFSSLSCKSWIKIKYGVPKTYIKNMYYEWANEDTLVI